MLAWATATLALILLVLGFAATYPTGALQQCRAAFDMARTR